MGGHSDTYFVAFDVAGRGQLTESMAPGAFAIDIGVQFVCPSLYPNLYALLALPEFDGMARLALSH